jgi:hypothetical protein
MRSSVLSALFLAIALFFSGCAKPQIIKEAVYLDKPCDRAGDYAHANWLPVRWIAISIDGVGYVATPDGEALLGNLLRLRERKPNADLNVSDNVKIGPRNPSLALGTPSTISNATTNSVSGTTHTHALAAPVLTAGGAYYRFTAYSPAQSNNGSRTFSRTLVCLANGVFNCTLSFSTSGSSSYDYALRVYKNGAAVASGSGNDNNGSFSASPSVSVGDKITFELYYEYIAASIAMTLNIDVGVSNLAQLLYLRDA